MDKFGLVFDMDGVLLDSHRMIWDAFNSILSRYNVFLGEQDIKKYVGISLRDDILLWNQRYNLSLNLEEFTKEAWDKELKILMEMTPDKNLILLLDEMTYRGVPMGVGTSSQKFRADTILESLGLKKYFPVVVTANDVQRHKPHPDLFLEVSNRIETPPSRCVVFEDAQSGIDAAHRGGMIAIGYNNGHNDDYELRGADKIIKRFYELDYDSIENLVTAHRK